MGVCIDVWAYYMFQTVVCYGVVLLNTVYCLLIVVAILGFESRSFQRFALGALVCHGIVLVKVTCKHYRLH